MLTKNAISYLSDQKVQSLKNINYFVSDKTVDRNRFGAQVVERRYGRVEDQ